MKRTHIVMDMTGDTRVSYDLDNAQALADAQKQFDELLKNHTAARKADKPGEFQQVRAFDPKDDEVVFYRRVVGG